MPKSIRHNWLPKEDSANSEGYWVPTPDQIAEECAILRSLNLQQLLTSIARSEENIQRPPDQIDTSNIGYKHKAIEETQICDCPYWGTEFTE